MKDKRTEALKDRRDYRQTLIERRNALDVKVKTVEAEIRKLEGKPGE
jgi:hypothetical protein